MRTVRTQGTRPNPRQKIRAGGRGYERFPGLAGGARCWGSDRYRWRCPHARRPFSLWNLHEDVAMSAKKPANDTKPTTVVVHKPEEWKGELKSIGGSKSDEWNNLLANQAMQALWLKNSDVGTRDKQRSATI